MKVIFTKRAFAQLREISTYIGNDNKDAASDFARRVEALAQLIGKHP